MARPIWRCQRLTWVPPIVFFQVIYSGFQVIKLNPPPRSQHQAFHLLPSFVNRCGYLGICHKMSKNWDKSYGSFSPWWYNNKDKPTASSNIPSEGEEQHIDSIFNPHLPLLTYPNLAPVIFKIQNNLPTQDLPAFTPEPGVQEPEILPNYRQLCITITLFHTVCCSQQQL